MFKEKIRIGRAKRIGIQAHLPCAEAQANVEEMEIELLEEGRHWSFVISQ